MLPMLVALTEGPNIPLDKPILLIGRHQECDVLIPSRKISRRHCCVAQVHDCVVVKDLFSTNGVRINGQRVREGVLRSGDELTIGNFRYRIEIDGSDLAPVDGNGLQAAESCDLPMPLEEDANLGPAPRARPLVLPVNGPKPRGADPFAENVKLAPAGSDEFRRRAK